MPWDERKEGDQVYRLDVDGEQLVYGTQLMFGSDDIITVKEILNPVEIRRSVKLQDDTIKQDVPVIMERWGEHTFFYAKPEDL